MSRQVMEGRRPPKLNPRPQIRLDLEIRFASERTGLKHRHLFDSLASKLYLRERLRNRLPDFADFYLSSALSSKQFFPNAHDERCG
jgi:hypothetical protein